MGTIGNKTKRWIRLCLMTMLAVLLFFSSSLSVMAATKTLIFSAGETKITINLEINESTASGGVELGVSCSSGLDVIGFSIDDKLLSVSKSISGQKDGVNYYGFYADKNFFQGQVKVGKLELTYNGNGEEKLTIDELKVYRVNDDQTITAINKGSQEYIIKRSTASGGHSGGGSSVTVTIGDEEEIPAAPIFPDCTGHWAEKDILTAVGKGFVTGYPGGTFRPNNPVTRAEFVTMLIKANAVQKGAKTLDFTDVDNHWAQTSIVAASSNGYINGYPDGTFRPNNNINRQEVAKIMADFKALGEVDVTLPFSDAGQIGSWALPSVKKVYQGEIMKGDTNNNFAPQANTTRAEAVAIILRCMD